MGQIGPKWAFSDQISVHLAPSRHIRYIAFDMPTTSLSQNPLTESGNPDCCLATLNVGLSVCKVSRLCVLECVYYVVVYSRMNVYNIIGCI